MITINWDDIKHNGMPAINQALQTLLKAINALEIRHNLEIYQLEERVRRLEESRAPASGEREIVQELGNGWRIERQPATPNASAATSVPPAARPATIITTSADTWLPDDCWVQYFAAIGE
jgi:hypothetical protein